MSSKLLRGGLARISRRGVGVALLACAVVGAGCAEATAPVEASALSAEEAKAAYENAFMEKDDEKADRNNCSGVRLPDQGDFGGRIALTFDDGPDPIHTPKVMAALRAFDAPATFFVLGKATVGEARQSVLADLVADERYIVANHTWNHPDMARQTGETVATELDRNTAALEAAGVTPKFFRFPYGSSNCATAEAVRNRGMAIVGWHVDSADWCYAVGNGYCSPRTFQHVPDRHRDHMIGYILAQVATHNGGVLLFHDVHGYTADHLPEILAALVEAGYTFTGLDDAETFPRLNGVEPPPQPFVGSPCVDDTGCGFSAGGQDGLCHPAGLCVLPCAGGCPDRAGFAPTFCVADSAESAPDGPGGICVPQAADSNGDCADLPGTLDLTADRFVGDSGASARQARACVPSAATVAPTGE